MANFGSSTYGKLGYNIDTMRNLVRENFNGTQIRHAGEDSNKLNLDPNRFGRNFAHPDRVAPTLRKERNQHFGAIDGHFGNIHRLEGLKDKESDPTKRAAIQSQIDSAWTAARKHRRDMSSRHPTAAQPHVDSIINDGLAPKHGISPDEARRRMLDRTSELDRTVRPEIAAARRGEEGAPEAIRADADNDGVNLRGRFGRRTAERPSPGD